MNTATHSALLKVWCLVVLLPFLAVAASDAATIQPRTALVIGNAAYTEARLQNPVNDATDMAATLRQVGFSVTLLRDVNQQRMEEAIDQFGLILRQGGVGLFYFAGHGVQVAGQNYLIPLGARLRRESAVRYEAVHVGRVLDSMQDANNGLNVVILDACRNNPFARRWRRFRSTPLPRGLAIVQAVRGTLIAYATEPGGLAADGAGRNGIYTKNLLRYMKEPGLAIERMFRQVRVAVLDETGGKQTPWESSSLTGEFAFVPLPQSPAVAPPASPQALPLEVAPDPELAMWKLVQDTSQSQDLEFFLRTYPQSRYAPLARLKLQQLKRLKTPPTPAPSQPTSPSSTPVARVDPTSQPQAERHGRFLKQVNNTALDTTTKLMWMTKDFRNIEGRAPVNWDEAMAWAAKMNRQRYGGYNDWRIPTLKEYRALYDKKTSRLSYKGESVGYPEAFETGGGVWFWTVEEVDDISHNRDVEPNYQAAWSFDYRRGRTRIILKNGPRAEVSIRLVRRGQQ